ncbi:carboxypeptidase-like regulatory domain-containing protein [Marinifilum sp.]|uniref:carboxypeptidase-like regulatory domain-containing protein n=1 Tax=Marinifilum sp. TaxID=2033137 RepID=UPI003BAAF53B
MRKVYRTYREMKRRLQDFYVDNQTEFDAIPILKEIFEALFAEFDKFESAWVILDKDYTGSTQKKQELKMQVCKQLSKCNMLIYNDCIKNDLSKELPNFKGSEAKMFRHSDERLISRCEYSINYLENMGEKLSETGLSTQDLDELKILYERYEAMAPRPKVLQGMKKIARQDIADALSAGVYLINERLDKVMKSMFEGSKSDLYKTYLEASEVEKPNSSKIALKGKIVDKNTKEPVPKAHLIIKEVDLDHLVTGGKGGFRINSLEPGSYELKVEAVTYKTITMNLVHRHGQTNVLEIEMEAENSEQ